MSGSRTTQSIPVTTLSQWAEYNIRQLAHAKGPEEFDGAFNEFVSANVKSITYNGRPVSREEYKRALMTNEMPPEKTGTVKFGGVIGRPVPGEKKDKIHSAGLVGAFYDTNFDVQGVGLPDELISRSSMNMEVHEDPSIPFAEGGIIPGPDARRVFRMDHVDIDRTVIDGLNPGPVVNV